MMFIDSHAHLEMPEFRDDLEEVIQRAKANDIGCVFTVGTEEKDWERAVEISRSHPSVYAVLGVHPHNAKEVDEQTYSTLKRLCREEKVRGLGEIGLDFYRDHSPRDLQLKRFREQIGLAKALGLPIVVHDRDAHRETLDVLKTEKAWECGGIIHCFSGDDAMAKKCLDMGFHISVPGSITFRKTEKFQEIVRRLPLESLLLETDAPFLTPVPLRGKRNEPGYLRYTAEKVSEIRGISLEKLAEATTANARRVYRLE